MVWKKSSAILLVALEDTVCWCTHLQNALEPAYIVKHDTQKRRNEIIKLKDGKTNTF